MLENTSIPATIRLAAIFNNIDFDKPFKSRSGTLYLLIWNFVKDKKIKFNIFKVKVN